MEPSIYCGILFAGSRAFLLIGGTIGWLFQQHQLVFSTQSTDKLSSSRILR